MRGDIKKYLKDKPMEALATLKEEGNESLVFKIGKSSDLFKMIVKKFLDVETKEEVEIEIKRELDAIFVILEDYNKVYNEYVESLDALPVGRQVSEKSKHERIKRSYNNLLDARNKLANTVYNISRNYDIYERVTAL